MRGRLRTSAGAAAIAILALGRCGPVPGRPTAAEIDVRPDHVTDFSLLYSENCAGCHGPSGRGGAGAVGLADAVYLAVAEDAVLRRAAANGISGTQMPAFAKSAGGMLTDAQIEILVRGIRAWAKPDALGGVEPPPYANAPGDAARGAEVFARSCASCHGPAGAGGPKAGSVVDGTYLGLVSDQSLRTTVIAGRPDIGQPDWRGDGASPLTSQDVSDVVAWLAAQRPAHPGQPYAEAKP